MEQDEKKNIKEQLAIIKSKNREKGIGNRKKVVLSVNVKDIPDGVEKDDLVVAFKLNANEEKEKGEKGKFKAKYLVPILVPLVLIGAIKGCTNSKDVPVDIKTGETIVQQINGQYYDVESPYIFMEGVTNAAGQEGLTANELEDGNTLHGNYYDADEQFKNEEQASMGQDEFSQMEEEVNECMKTLTSSDASQQEKNEAAKKALDINQKIEKIYTDNLSFVEKEAKQFEESSEAFKDSHTDSEIDVIRATIDEYKENLGLTTSNVTMLAQIVELTEDGYSIDVKGESNQRGDYSISGEAIKKVAESVGFDKETEKTYNEFLQNREQTKDNRDIGGDYNER